jgi:thiosulfate dehydrogenase (quinone) large subunit
MINNTLFFLLIRFAIAASMFGHGLARMPKLKAFSNWMVMDFEKSIIPKTWVRLFSYALPFIELSVGVLLFIGLFTQAAAAAGGFITVVFILGSTLTEKWDALPSQLTHTAFFAALLYFIHYNALALDSLIILP